MGVLGLTPFLQKVCPEAIHKLPDRLRGLTGKTIVIDGTLITQRFHFAPLPHRYRHVLGWYRLMQEVRESGVNAICVFDGKERSMAKAREVSRRRETRALAMARGALEVERLRRLRGLEPLLERFSRLDDAERTRILEALKASAKPISGLDALSHEQELISATVAASNSAETYTRAVEDYVNRIEDEDSAAGTYDSVPDVEDVWHVANSHPPVRTQTSALPQSQRTETLPSPEDEDVEPLDDLEGDPLPDPHTSLPGLLTQEQEHDLPPLPPADGELPTTSAVSPTDITTLLISLYQEYRSSIPKVAALTVAPATPESQSDAQSDMIMTKEQRQLTLDEGGFWKELQTSRAYSTRGSSGSAKAKSKYAIDTLMQKSALMHASFDRRAHPPTEATYRESKEILAALGVPCVDATGAFEAEALASAMVLGGLADYVVSEDTDVLVYGAPLLRNLSNRQGPLVLLPASLWDLLHLSRKEYVDFALLLGTDFSQRIKNVGPARALKFIRTHGSIERIVDEETKYPPRIPVEEYLHSVAVARAIFATLPALPAPEALQQGEMDEVQVNEVLHKYDLETYLRDDEWDYDSGVGTSFFGDDPRT
ncbi:PIN domain-like protein [Schizophyllum commune H4-8]|uniref:PIN domain-like protein n=1 Tax=Schizophyllum commune (strain H4-8 / FGSC 9210) TaxID=578458 RepID=UPI0021602196|nr:PIN domain-like protein [Schizophyllum commune H4-8]KAI5887089.1 PIN domain-like protein [Schizophyllum commune H4-8]